MRDPGWTLSDLDGELWSRGLSIDDISDAEINDVLQCRTPEQAARETEYRKKPR